MNFMQIFSSPVDSDTSLEASLWIPDHSFKRILKEMVFSYAVDFTPSKRNFIAGCEIVNLYGALGRIYVIEPGTKYF